MTNTAWPVWRKIVFRFFFVYLLLQLAPWTWLDGVPYIGVATGWVNGYYNQANDAVVNWANTYVFKLWPVLVPVNGSGDTSYGWTQLFLYLSLAAIACVVWTIFDRRSSYNTADYWMRTFLRYFIAMTALSYGIIKVFALQMGFPTVSQLVTPLGDFLPMRFSWLFIGYSTQYQVFSGVMETVAGLLLLNRRTVTLGLIMAAGVFANVFMMNLSYDIPVKIFSGQLFFYSLFLLLYDSPRLIRMLVLNQPSEGTNLYEFTYEGKWRWVRIVAKSIFVFVSVGLLIFNTWQWSGQRNSRPHTGPIPMGLYDVTSYVVNGDTIQYSPTDSLRWRDVVFERGEWGSIGTTDSIYWQRYRRGYFSFDTDKEKKLLRMFRESFSGDSTFLFDMKYQLDSSGQVLLAGKVKGDSLHVQLTKSRRHFQLTERQFHWLSEYNR